MNKIVHVNRANFDVYMGRKWAGTQNRLGTIRFASRTVSVEAAIVPFAVYFYAPEQKWLREKALAEKYTAKGTIAVPRSPFLMRNGLCQGDSGARPTFDPCKHRNWLD